jgi:hypothetical protein
MKTRVMLAIGSALFISAVPVLAQQSSNCFLEDYYPKYTAPPVYRDMSEADSGSDRLRHSQWSRHTRQGLKLPLWECGCGLGIAERQQYHARGSSSILVTYPNSVSGRQLVRHLFLEWKSRRSARQRLHFNQNDEEGNCDLRTVLSNCLILYSMFLAEDQANYSIAPEPCHRTYPPVLFETLCGHSTRDTLQADR